MAHCRPMGIQGRNIPLGESSALPAMLQELRRAERYIFLEYFIIEEGKMWDSLLEILAEKAKAG